MLRREVCLEAKSLTERHGQGDHHRHAGEDGPGYEVRSENGGVPARHDCNREVPRHHRVDGEDQRRRQRGQEDVGLPEVMPLAVRATPTERDDFVELLPQTRRRVPRSRQIRNGTQVEEDRRDREIRRHGEDVPHQRGTEVRPKKPAVRIRDEPVCVPNPSHMDERKQARRHDREHRHRFGRAVDRLAPRSAEQKEDRGNQRPRVCDTDPEHEGGDVDAPAHGTREPGYTDALHHLNAPRKRQEPDPGNRKRQKRPPAQARRAERLQNGAIDLVERVDVRVRERPACHFGRGIHQCSSATSWNVTFFK